MRNRAATTPLPRIVPDGPPTTPAAATDDGLASRAREALGLLERYRHVDPVAALCGLRLRPAADRYLEQYADAGARPAHMLPPVLVRRARASAHLRTRLDLWSALLARDVPGFLRTCEQPALRAAHALSERATGMIELARTYAGTGNALPYGRMLIDDLRGARIELERCRGVRGDTRPLPHGGETPSSELETELSTFADVLVALLGRDHIDARRALRCRAA